MTAYTVATVWKNELSPNAGLKELWLQSYNTADATNTFAVTLASYGISATGILFIESYVQTADGSIITAELNTCAVSAGVLTITVAAGTNDDTRVVHIVGRSIPNMYT